MVETDDVHLETLEQFPTKTQSFTRTSTNEQFDTRIPKPKTGATPKLIYGKTLPSLSRKGTSESRGHNTSNRQISHGIAEVTATVTVKLPVELKKERPPHSSCSNIATVPHCDTLNSDMEVLDVEDDLV